MRQYTSPALQRVIYNLRSIQKMMMRCSLLTGSIDKIDLCATDIGVYIPIIVYYLGCFNAPKVFYGWKSQLLVNKSHSIGA